ncbi:MAG: hypothetical protein JW806_09410, partial [Sedimentisphaerales bacterium]|nr:hypothetical protein [Sedimentisphaerales bacterium]
MAKLQNKLLMSIWIVLFLTVFITPTYAGEIIGWGTQKTPNAPLKNVTAISAGYGHSLALKSDGSIVGWGYDLYGLAPLPDGNDFVAIAAGG